MIKKISLLAASVTLALSLTACNQTTSTQQTAASNLRAGIELSNMAKSNRPQDDFYRYVNGTWLENTQIPADRSNYGSFTQLAEDAQTKLRHIIERTAAGSHAFGSNEQKLADFYNSIIDEQTIESLGYEPVKPQLGRIAALESHQQVMSMFAQLNHIGVTTPMSWYVNNDAKNSTQYITVLGQSGLGLPDRDYYMKPEMKSSKIRADYQRHIAQVLTLIGYPNPQKAAIQVLGFESQLAERQWSRVDNRDPVKTYNKLDLVALNQLLAKLGQGQWNAYADSANLSQAEQVVVRQPSYVRAMAQLVADTDIEAIKAYMSFHLVSDYSESMSKAFADLRFEFFDKRLRGVEEQSPRWKQAVKATNSAVGEILGQLYVKDNFKPEAKARMEKMVQNLIKAYDKRIDGLEWMGDETKLAAKEKLSKFTYKIGYPDKWKDYSALEIKAGDVVGNNMRFAQWYYNRQAAKLGKPIDKTEWFMPPQTVNAYYNPVMNEIVFPAAILQPPFFNMEADDAVNYGGIGAVIGHELGHGFDDSGSQYDGDGNIRDWWTEQDKKEFNKREDKFSAQFSKLKPFPDANINGDLTLGENIGDLGGLTVSLEAYRLSLNGEQAPEIGGYTGEQRFFIGWGQIWRRLYREEELRKRLVTDSHSPSEYRVNGILPNIPDFYQAFDVQPGDGMYLPEKERVSIW